MGKEDTGLLAASEVILGMKAAWAQKMRDVTAKAKGIPKKGFNKHFEYWFVREVDVAEYMQKILYECGIFASPSFDEIEHSLPDGHGKGFLTSVTGTIEYIDIETGFSVTKGIFGTGSDKQDKGLYKAKTGAVKYGLVKQFNIPIGNDPEEDQYSGVQLVETNSDRVVKKKAEERKVGDQTSGMSLAEEIANLTKSLPVKEVSREACRLLADRKYRNTGAAVMDSFKEFSTMDFKMTVLPSSDEGRRVMTVAASAWVASNGALPADQCMDLAHTLVLSPPEGVQTSDVEVKPDTTEV